jgi:hypothetical protein
MLGWFSSAQQLRENIGRSVSFQDRGYGLFRAWQRADGLDIENLENGYRIEFLVFKRQPE